MRSCFRFAFCRPANDDDVDGDDVDGDDDDDDDDGGFVACCFRRRTRRDEWGAHPRIGPAHLKDFAGNAEDTRTGTAVTTTTTDVVVVVVTVIDIVLFLRPTR